MGKRAQRIPSWPGVIHSNKGRIHLRRPTCDILTFRLRRRGGPYIRENEACQRLVAIPGIGPVTATAVIAAIGNGAAFHKGREFAAWLDEFWVRIGDDI